MGCLIIPLSSIPGPSQPPLRLTHKFLVLKLWLQMHIGHPQYLAVPFQRTICYLSVPLRSTHNPLGIATMHMGHPTIPLRFISAPSQVDPQSPWGSQMGLSGHELSYILSLNPPFKPCLDDTVPLCSHTSPNEHGLFHSPSQVPLSSSQVDPQSLE